MQLTARDGTARLGEDYGAAGVTVVIPPGALEAVWEAPLVDDFRTETEETFEIRVGLVRNATLGGGSSTVTIVDDDPADALTVRALPVAESAGSARVEILRSAPGNVALRVAVATRPGTGIGAGGFRGDGFGSGDPRRGMGNGGGDSAAG